MDTKAVFAALYSVCEENATFFSGGAKGSQGDAARRLVDVMKLIQEHARSLEPVISGFASVYHHFDFDPHIPANGYRSLVKVGCGLFRSLESNSSSMSVISIFFFLTKCSFEYNKSAYCNTFLSVFSAHCEKQLTNPWYFFVPRSVHLFYKLILCCKSG